MTIRNLQDIRTTAQLRDVADTLGSPFFSPETMSSFGSRLSSHIRALSPGHGYFVTSERDPQGEAWNGERRYSVRSYRVVYLYDEHGTPSDSISFDTIYHGEHTTMRAAVRAMNAL